MLCMDFSDFVGAVLAANMVTALFIWGVMNLNKHDTDAPWVAYAAVIMPLIFVAASVILTEGLPPQFDALDSLLSAERQD